MVLVIYLVNAFYMPLTFFISIKLTDDVVNRTVGK